LKPVKRRLQDFSVLTITLLLCFGLGEVAARAVVPAPLAWKWPQVAYEPSASLGFRLRPGQDAFTADKPSHTNSIGLRGPERSLKKPEGVKRILILGDSIAFGYGVAYEDTFAVKLEEMLNQSDSGKRYEVIDSGVPSYNTLQEVTYFREEGVRLEPDIVILAVCWNDISSKSGVAVDEKGRLFDEAARPDPGRVAQWSETERGYWARNALKRSSLLYFVIDRARSVRIRLTGDGSVESNRPADVLTARQLAVLTGRADPAVAAGWVEVDSQLKILADLCAARGIRLVVALAPMPQLLEAQYPKAQYPSQVTRMCEKYGVRCLDLLPAFAQDFRGHTSLFIPYDGDHPNESGHLIIAKQLFTELQESSSR